VHPLVKQTIKVISLVLVGVVLTLMAIYGLLSMYAKPSPNAEERRKQWVLEYSNRQQAELGVNCKDLRVFVQMSLQTTFQPVVAARVPGSNWTHLVSRDSQENIDKTSWVIRRCSMLFHDGETGRLNGLEDIGFVDELLVEYAKYKVPLLHGPSAHCNTDACRDTSFSELKKNYEHVLALLAKDAQSIPSRLSK
jgi:hypothetical protein